MSPSPVTESAGQPPPLGFIGWGEESAALLEALRERFPHIESSAFALVDGTGALHAPLRQGIPSLEGLFEAAEIIFVEGGAEILEPHLPMMRLAISDRHMLVLLGRGWSMDGLLRHLKERKLVRCMLLPSGPKRLSTLAYHAAPYFSPAEIDDFCSLFGHLELTVALKNEAHFEVLQGLAGFAPAAFFTIMEAMADGVVMMGLSRPAALKFLATLLHGASRKILDEQGSPAALREQALEIEVAAAGLIELESAGVRGTLMRAIQRAVDHSRSKRSLSDAGYQE